MAEEKPRRGRRAQRAQPAAAPPRGHLTDFLRWLANKRTTRVQDWGHGRRGVNERAALIRAWEKQTGQTLSDRDKALVRRGDFAYLRELSDHFAFILVMMTSVADRSEPKPPAES